MKKMKREKRRRKMKRMRMKMGEWRRKERRVMREAEMATRFTKEKTQRFITCDI